MNAIDTICSLENAPAQANAGQRGRLLGLIIAILAAVTERQSKRRSRMALRGLTRDQLNDIGLTPEQVSCEVAKSFFWD